MRLARRSDLPLIVWTNWRGWTFDVADLSQVAWPTSTGGNTRPRGSCPLDAFTRGIYSQTGESPDAGAVLIHLQGQRDAQAKCYHHAPGAAALGYLAKLTVWMVEHRIEAHEDIVRAVVLRDGHAAEWGPWVTRYFDEPIKWTFAPGTEVSDGQHRICALKTAGVARVAMLRL